jgi:hypothetical protein
MPSAMVGLLLCGGVLLHVRECRDVCGLGWAFSGRLAVNYCLFFVSLLFFAGKYSLIEWVADSAGDSF